MNVNKVFIAGNLTRDVTLSYLPSQTAVADFGMAINRRFTKSNGEQCEETCFVDVRAFGKPAETINKYCKKGNPLFVEGRLTFDSWTGKDGEKRSKLRVMIESFQFIGGSAKTEGTTVNDTPEEPQGDTQQDDDSSIPF